MSKQIDIEGLAHEIWAAGQLAPEEGIEDGVLRIAQILVEMQAAERERCARLCETAFVGGLILGAVFGASIVGMIALAVSK